MELREGLSKIGLSGFQVFDKYTEIPLSRLTFLFGPNSAGKSSIEDALSLGRSIWSVDPYALDSGGGLLRHWRRTGADADDYVPNVQIDLTIDVAVELNESFCISTGRDLVSYGRPSYEAQQITLRATFARGEFFTSSCYERVRVEQREVLADGLPLFAYALGGESYINFAHPLFRDIEPLEDFQEAAARWPHIFEFDNQVVKFKSDAGVRLPYWRTPWRFHTDSLLFSDKSEAALRTSFEGQEAVRAFFEGLEIPDTPLAVIEVVPAIKEFAFFIAVLEELVCSYALISTDVVPASRQVPTEKDLTIVVQGGSDVRDITTLFDVENFGIASLCGDQRYYGVAKSFVHSKLESVNRESDEGATTESADGQSIHERVNLYLTDYLFVERGFCLNFDYLVLLSPSEYGSLAESCGGDDGSEDARELPAAIVRISLVDSKSRRFSFEEVGSGLGYVLPVLCSAADPRSLVLIQQPELHLHPALQAAMGDVLIDASRQRHSTLIVETHSEHLLLRVLKRVRQSSAGTRIPDQLRIASDEVTVLYFNPLPDGTSEVQHLRVSRDGDFMDRWPRGFFEERDRELFDE